MKLNLSDFGKHKNFAPISLTKPIACIRMGIFTNTERYTAYLPEVQIGYKTEDYLADKYPSVDSDLTINACVLPNPDLIAAITHLDDNQSLFAEDVLLAQKGAGKEVIKFIGTELIIIEERWDLFQKNALALDLDFIQATNDRKSQLLSSTNLLIGPENRLFIEEGASIEGCTINTKEGPIYIGRDATIMEGSMIRGGLALNAYATIKMGTKIYGATTIGPHCKVGGEVNNVIFQAYSNKGHDGFLGNSVIGEWCNLGADTNTSNLKNNYAHVRTHCYSSKTEIQTDLQFIGLSMGDYSKCAINTMFNTATVVGVSCNIVTHGFPKKYIPSFSWVQGETYTKNKLEKAFDAANNMMYRRKLSLSKEDKAILKHLARARD